MSNAIQIRRFADLDMYNLDILRIVSQSSYGTSLLQLLPIDCWMNVSDYLSHEDFASVALVSKDFHASTTPFMYRTVSWNWNTVLMQNILRLLRSIFKRPDITPSIHHVRVLSSTDRM
ncbi:uncharacterized protein ASPGLDRAFT_32071 [Aspergillus glaucus CBS 516.65]|uniref:F-box domain-containing protein n=1 Tax=Aspergillus glaucus CBS 516.65 TaxID=1160497 RepID=A0A1L9VUJ2_ASPGL|nr:hypothetical protein ASPGLDRAFT_32071 [Aspergillus glaucus CBS 516.65]OJJ87574.1 hypothetical protein ASPGLDRAFT_32071 [Aspergillus glaucus CBS 516.65]